MKLTDLLIEAIVRDALREDIRSGDITTDALIPDDLRGSASLNFREEGVVCGLQLAACAFQTLDPNAGVEFFAADGDIVDTGAEVMRVEGKASAILTAERVALNFSQRMSGVATNTRKFVQALEGTSARIIDTRKTTPGLRLLEKYAVRCGGGTNHRYALDDLILIKDNHVALCGGIAEAVRRGRAYASHAVKVEVECDTLEQVKQAVEAGADIILLDNMVTDVLREAVGIIDKRAVTEASGGVNLDTVRAIAQSGVDLISIGALTHSVKSMDIGLDIRL